MAPRRNNHAVALHGGSGNGAGTELQGFFLDPLTIDNHEAGTTHCCVPGGECLHNQQPIPLNDLEDVVKVICNNDHCTVGKYMHRECFEHWEQSVLNYLKTCGRARSWSERQRHQNLWTKKGYDLAFKACGCKCGRGHLKKDLDWVPPSSGSVGSREDLDASKKKKRKSKASSRPTLAISATHTTANINGKTFENHLLTSADLRARTGSLSSSTGSSSPPASASSISPVHSAGTGASKRKIKFDFLSDRHISSMNGSGIFTRRQDFTSFNSIPKVKLNSYNIKTKAEGKTQYLSAVCMGCLQGWTKLRCRTCSEPWDGSSLMIGSMYSYDIFAATPCCADRLKCNGCQKALLLPHQRLNFFSDYSHKVACPHCGVQDNHFVKPLPTCFTRGWP